MAKTTYATTVPSNGKRQPQVDTTMKNCRENETFRLELLVKLQAEYPEHFKSTTGRREKTEGTGIQLIPQESDGQLDINAKGNVQYLVLDSNGEPAKPIEALDVLIRKYSQGLPKFGWAPSQAFEGNHQIPALKGFPKRRYMAFSNFVRLVQEWGEDTEQDYVDFTGLDADKL